MKKSINLYINIFKDLGPDGWNYLLGNLFAGFGFAAFSLLFNLFLKSNGIGESVIGNLLSVGTYVTVLFIFPAAFLVKRIRIKWIIVLIPVVTVFGYLIAIQSNTIIFRMLGFVISGTAGAFSSVIGGPFIMRITEQKTRTFMFSINHATMLTAGITGNLIAGFLPQIIADYGFGINNGYRYAIFIHLLFAVSSVFFYSRIKADRIYDEKADKRLSLKTSKKVLFYLTLPPMVVGLGAGMTIPFLNIYFKTVFNLSSGSIGILFATAQLLTIFGALSAPIFAKKYGLIKSVIISQVFSIPFLALLGFTKFLPVAIVAFLIRNMLMNMSNPLSNNFSLEIVHPDDRPLTSGLLSIAWLATWGLTANIGGLLIEKSGYMLPFAFTIFFYFLSSTLYYKLLYPLDKSRNAN